uniref:Uncharacterized protein n=1 Tax=Nelumbo nucifera TaxID=4432 RepID=A0A822Y799_NELNU|nr:TPA_asm: hypothetical protein HUJ06_029848 [Nelumbo nucifera]
MKLYFILLELLKEIYRRDVQDKRYQSSRSSATFQRKNLNKVVKSHSTYERSERSAFKHKPLVHILSFFPGL